MYLNYFYNIYIPSISLKYILSFMIAINLGLAWNNLQDQNYN